MALQIPADLVAEALRISVKGQDHVVPAIAQLLVNGEIGYSRPGRPKGTFLFLGPTGVGKTEITKCMSEVLYGHPNLHVFDMGGFPEAVDATRFKELLAEKLDAVESNALLLFDEIEKAHKTIVDLFLSMTDEARFVYEGRAFDLSNCYLVCTSNLGCKEIIRMKESDISVIERFAKIAAQDYFRPEGLVRFKNISVFNLLKYDVQVMICKGMVNKYAQFLLETKNITLDVSNEAVLFLIEKGVNQALGARPLLNAIEERIPRAIVAFDQKHGRDLHQEEARRLYLDLGPSRRSLVVREMESRKLESA